MYRTDMTRQESRELVDLMRTQFPKFSKVTLCMIRNPEYGVDFSAKAKKLIEKKKPRKSAERKRLTVRVSDDLYDAVKEMAIDGSYQKLVERIIADAIGGKDGTDPGRSDHQVDGSDRIPALVQGGQ